MFERFLLNFLGPLLMIPVFVIVVFPACLIALAAIPSERRSQRRFRQARDKWLAAQQEVRCCGV